VIVVNTTVEGQHNGPGIHHLVGKAGEVLPALVRAAWSGQSQGRHDA
jgi:hypothetical protein